MAKRITKTYDQEFKSQAIKLAQEIGGHKAAAETAIHTPSNALSLNEELIELRKRVRDLDKENRD